MADKAEKKPDAAPAAAPAPGSASAAAGAAGTPATGAAHGATKGGVGGMLAKTPVMLGGVMILEAIVLFAGFKFLAGGPHTAAGADLAHEDPAKNDENGEGHGEKKSSAPKAGTIELQVLEFRAQNKLSGRTFLYDVSVYVVTKSEFAEKVKATLAAREALIKDRVRTIIAQNDPEKLGGGSEPGLETLRRQVKHQLDEIVGDGMIEEVLVPRCIPFRTDF
jgi:flagellar basal body-associated protein FliL